MSFVSSKANTTCTVAVSTKINLACNLGFARTRHERCFCIWLPP